MQATLDRVTITGADDSIKPADLLPLTAEFPFVEWGVLASENNTLVACGHPRYPSPGWIKELQALAELLPRLAMHINGNWVRDLLIGGDGGVPRWLFDRFARVQLNFHGQESPCIREAFVEALKRTFPGKELIFQLDDSGGGTYLEAAAEAIGEGAVSSCVGLFDTSGGAGILPGEWSRPLYIEHLPEGDRFTYHGYAGGLGPDNLAEQLPLILAAASNEGAGSGTQPGRIWIDMETRVRSDEDQLFDLAKVRRCLEISAPFVS